MRMADHHQVSGIWAHVLDSAERNRVRLPGTPREMAHEFLKWRDSTYLQLGLPLAAADTGLAGAHVGLARAGLCYLYAALLKLGRWAECTVAGTVRLLRSAEALYELERALPAGETRMLLSSFLNLFRSRPNAHQGLDMPALWLGIFEPALEPGQRLLAGVEQYLRAAAAGEVPHGGSD